MMSFGDKFSKRLPRSLLQHRPLGFDTRRRARQFAPHRRGTKVDLRERRGKQPVFLLRNLDGESLEVRSQGWQFGVKVGWSFFVEIFWSNEEALFAAIAHKNLRRDMLSHWTCGFAELDLVIASANGLILSKHCRCNNFVECESATKFAVPWAPQLFLSLSLSLFVRRALRIVPEPEKQTFRESRFFVFRYMSHDRGWLAYKVLALEEVCLLPEGQISSGHTKVRSVKVRRSEICYPCWKRFCKARPCFP